MPRANRYLLPGHVVHLTHRCHNREFFLKFQRDRRAYRWWLWEALRRHPVSLLAYALTSDHVHWLVQIQQPQQLSRCVGLVHGCVAQQFIRRKHRCGSFWAGRFHITMVESGEYLWRCLLYIELNMVRAGAVDHPADWPWCSFAKLRGGRQRHQIFDLPALLRLVGAADLKEFLRHQEASIRQELERRRFARCPFWTESVAVGSERFVRSVAAQISGRQSLEIGSSGADGQSSTWFVRKKAKTYETSPKNAV